MITPYACVVVPDSDSSSWLRGCQGCSPSLTHFSVIAVGMWLTLWPQNSFPRSSHFQELNTLPTFRCHHWCCVHSTDFRLQRASVHGWPLPLIPLMSLKGHDRGRHKWRHAQLSWQFSSNRRREKVSLKCDTWNTSNLDFYWWGTLPTIHQGCSRAAVYQPQNTCRRRGGAAAFEPPHLKGGMPRFWYLLCLFISVVPHEKRPTFWWRPKESPKGREKQKECHSTARKGQMKAQRSKWHQ